MPREIPPLNPIILLIIKILGEFQSVILCNIKVFLGRSGGIKSQHKYKAEKLFHYCIPHISMSFALILSIMNGESKDDKELETDSERIPVACYGVSERI